MLGTSSAKFRQSLRKNNAAKRQLEEQTGVRPVLSWEFKVTPPKATLDSHDIRETDWYWTTLNDQRSSTYPLTYPKQKRRLMRCSLTSIVP